MPYWKSNIEPLVAILLFLLTLIFAVGNMIINRDGKFICLIYSCCFLSLEHSYSIIDSIYSQLCKKMI